ncbi:MAG: hypothetical protein HYS57_03230 [Parcubacteria group bacterium]|nr:hypothetical protein [Parcubacteria group bacterium]
MIVAVVVALFLLRALYRKWIPTAVGTGRHWYQQPTVWLTIAVWLIGVALLYLLAQKYWKEETETVWGIWWSKENLWITAFALAFLIAAIAKIRLTRQAHTNTPSSYESRGEGRKRFSLGGAVWILIGVALLALLCLKVWHEFEFGLSNAPERFALRGYVPREQVAAALAAAVPALPEVHTIIAPPRASDGTINWSEPLIRKKSPHSILSYTAGEEMDPWVEKMVDGKKGLKIADHGTGIMVRFRSLTNHPIKITAVEQVF